MQIWMFVSGVFYATTGFKPWEQWVLALNPMTTVINGFQWATLRTPPPELGKSLVGIAATVVFLLVGLWYFRRSEPRFADTI
jgi:lipopolysaccharide transport system permease protein